LRGHVRASDTAAIQEEVAFKILGSSMIRSSSAAKGLLLLQMRFFKKGYASLCKTINLYAQRQKNEVQE
jgi:hypothetical protein